MACGFGPQKAKHFLSSMSEVLVTADEPLADVDRLEASMRINGGFPLRLKDASAAPARVVAFMYD